MEVGLRGAVGGTSESKLGMAGHFGAEIDQDLILGADQPRCQSGV